MISDQQLTEYTSSTDKPRKKLTKGKDNKEFPESYKKYNLLI